MLQVYLEEQCSSASLVISLGQLETPATAASPRCAQSNHCGRWLCRSLSVRGQRAGYRAPTVWTARSRRPYTGSSRHSTDSEGVCHGSRTSTNHGTPQWSIFTLAHSQATTPSLAEGNLASLGSCVRRHSKGCRFVGYLGRYLWVQTISSSEQHFRRSLPSGVTMTWKRLRSTEFWSGPAQSPVALVDRLLVAIS